MTLNYPGGQVNNCVWVQIIYRFLRNLTGTNLQVITGINGYNGRVQHSF